MRTLPGIAVNERPCTHGTLDVTDIETTLTKHCALLISYLHKQYNRMQCNEIPMQQKIRIVHSAGGERGMNIPVSAAHFG